MLNKLLLGTGPDTPGTESIYSGFTKLNSNTDLLTASTGADQVGFDDTSVAYTANTVQEAIEGVNNATGEINTLSNIGTGEGKLWYRKNGVNHEIKTIKAGANVQITENSSEVIITSTVSAPNYPNVKKIQQASYNVLSTDEVLLCNTNGIGIITINLSQGINRRVMTIKNIASATNTADVQIIPYGTEQVEDDRTGIPSNGVSIGTGSTIRAVFYSADNTWWIV